jgi:hypothetical protein
MAMIAITTKSSISVNPVTGRSRFRSLPMDHLADNEKMAWDELQVPVSGRLPRAAKNGKSSV